MCLITAATAAAGAIGSALTSTTATAGLSLIGSGISAYGQYMQGKAASQAASYNASIADANARSAYENANDALVRGQDEEQKVRRRTAAVKGSQVASMAANGVDIGWSDSSAQDVMTDTVMLGEIDALTTRKNSEREANAYNLQAANYENQASLYRKQKKSNSWLGAAGTLLTGMGSAYKIWAG
jgi:hypothetical protein